MRPSTRWFLAWPMLVLVGACPRPAGGAPEDGPPAVVVPGDGTGAVRDVFVPRAELRRLWPTWDGGPLAAEGALGPVRTAADGARVLARGEAPLVLRRGDGGVAPPAAAPRTATTLTAGAVRVASRAGNVFGDVASSDPGVYDRDVPHWYAFALPPGGTATTEVDRALPAPRAGEGPGVFSLRAVATHAGPVRLRVSVAGVDLGVAETATAAGGARFAWPLAGVGARAKGWRLEIADVSPPVKPSEDPDDVSDGVGTLWVESMTADVPAADAGAPGTLVEVEPGVWVPAVAHEVPAGGLVAWTPPPLGDVAAADMIVVAAPSLLEGARRLAAHRSAHGVAAVVVPTTALAPPGDADRLTAGIERLVATPRRHGDRPRYLLLVGDADRDRASPETVPARYVRTLYNGATATDRPYAAGGSGAIVGRLPFSSPAALDAYVARVVRAETAPPADDTRRTLRFVTSEGRFGEAIDRMLENLFTQVVAHHIPPSYDVEVTFARPKSDFGWPAAEFNDKVLDGLNTGALFFTYVGHGWWNGFDQLRVEGRRYPILRRDDAAKVTVRGTPPAVFVVACTTALFDDPRVRAVGEALLDRPEGPLAYWGATRVCHPAWNSVVGRQLAIEMFRDRDRRLGDVIDAAVRASVGPAPEDDMPRKVIELGARQMLKNPHVDLDRLKDEGAAMYVLLGDPALALPFPAEDLAVAAEATPKGVRVTVRGAVPDGTEVAVAVEVSRTKVLPLERDPSWSPEETMRRRHDRSNDKSVARAVGRAAGGVVVVELELPEVARGTLFAKARAIFGDDVHQGAASFSR